MGPHVFVSPSLGTNCKPCTCVETVSVLTRTGVPLLFSIHNRGWFRNAPVVFLWLLMLVKSRRTVIISFMQPGVMRWKEQAYPTDGRRPNWIMFKEI
jgi:hypothetical protein